MAKADTTSWRAATRLVRGGTTRSEFMETSEALFLNSGYVYPTAEEAEAAFANKLDRYVYSRYANPTLSMLEERLCLIEGAEACRTTASGMAAVYAALTCQLVAGDRVVAARALFSSSLYILNDVLARFGVEVAYVDGTDLNEWETALSKPTRCVLLENSRQSDSRAGRSTRGVPPRPSRRRSRHRRQRVRNAHTAAPARAGG